MRETVSDWKEEWINTNGVTTDLEVVITDSSLPDMAAYTYEGSFAQIPKRLLDRKVIKCGKILQSNIEERNGAYSLTI